MLKNRFFLIVLFILGITVGLFLHKINIFRAKPTEFIKVERLYPPNGHLVNPLIGFENPEGGGIELDDIKYLIGEYIKKCRESGSASSISVYLRNLLDGSWIGIDEDEHYAAASLFKVPLMLTYLKMAEKDPAILNKEIKYETKIDLPHQNIAPTSQLQLGNTYTIDELLRDMIVHSDNMSSQLLLENIDFKIVADIYSALQLSTPDLTEPEHQISAKDYATFFRVLYNSTFLSQDLSEKAIKWLTEAEFRDGVVAGVPDKIVIAHKFAERRYAGVIDLSQSVQLHDCGIVYYPKNPYVLCVMTRGRDLNTLKGIIKEVSRIVYEQKERRIL